MMNENEKRLWWQAYLAALTGMYAYGHAGEIYSIDGADTAAAKAADLALARYQSFGPDSPASEPEWTGHARVELMGHRTYRGRIREVERYGAKMCEVQELLPSGEYGEVHLFGGKSVYAIRNLSLEEVLKELRPTRCRTCSSKGCWTNVEVAWGHPAWADATALVLCEKCKAKGETTGEEKDADRSSGDDGGCSGCEHAQDCDNRGPACKECGEPRCACECEFEDDDDDDSDDEGTTEAAQ